MTNWQRVLRDNDPYTERMDGDAAARMREVVVRATRSSALSVQVWPMRFALAGFAVLVLMLSVLGTQRPATIGTDPGTRAVTGSERRQIQFATPGGTRIIWEINPDFTLGETIP